jgi:WD40 repeat protein
VKVWDLQGHDLLTLAPGKRIATAEWSPDGHRILTAHTDGTARLWDGVPWEEVGDTDDSSTSFEEQLESWRTRQAQRMGPITEETAVEK